MNSDGRPHSELTKIAVTLTAIATICPNRVEEPCGRNWYADAVEAEGESYILHHLAIAVAADLAGFRDQVEPRPQDDDVGRFDCDIGAGAGAECYADIRLHQRRGVVDAVADHRYLAPFLELADNVCLHAGQDAG